MSVVHTVVAWYSSPAKLGRCCGNRHLVTCKVCGFAGADAVDPDSRCRMSKHHRESRPVLNQLSGFKSQRTTKEIIIQFKVSRANGG